MKIEDLDKSLFMNIDTQKDFMNKDGALYVPGAENIKDKLREITQYASDNNIKVINTCDWHYEDSEEISDNPDYNNTFPPHCMARTDGAWFINETKPLDSTNISFLWDNDYSEEFISEQISKNREIIITKDKFNLFDGNKNSDKIIKKIKSLGYENIYIYGVATDICVAFAVIGMLSRGFNVYLIDNATAPLHNEDYKNLLLKWSYINNFHKIKI